MLNQKTSGHGQMGTLTELDGMTMDLMGFC